MFKLREDDHEAQTSKQFLAGPEDQLNRRMQIAIVADAPDCTAAAAYRMPPAEVRAFIEYLQSWLDDYHDAG